jgi:hypothetical protein
MKTQEQQTAASLHWLAFLLTGRRELAVDVTMKAMAARDDSNPFFASWMLGWFRRLVIAKALAAVRKDLSASARRLTSSRTRRQSLPPRSWALDLETPKSNLEHALLSIDLFPRAAILLLIFERVPLKDAAILLDADAALVRKAQAAGLRELTSNLARLQGWTSPATKSTAITSELQHA